MVFSGRFCCCLTRLRIASLRGRSNRSWRTSSATSGAVQLQNGHADFSQFLLDARYKFLDGMFRPFVETGLGGTWVNTNIASGPPQVGYWWDPWWGYICGSHQ